MIKIDIMSRRKNHCPYFLTGFVTMRAVQHIIFVIDNKDVTRHLERTQMTLHSDCRLRLCYHLCKLSRSWLRKARLILRRDVFITINR